MKRHHITSAADTWKGYSLEELRFQRMLALTRIEVERSKLLDAAEDTRRNLPVVGSATASTLFSSISKVEYIILAIRLFRKLAPLFRKNNRQ